MATDAQTDEGGADTFVRQKWQKCYFDLQDSEADPRTKVDAITGILQQMYQCRAQQSMDGAVLGCLARRYIKEHSSIVESANPEAGLNNYSDGALAICSNHPNESSEWTSSLSAESLRALPCVQAMLQSSKVSTKARKHSTPNETFELNLTSREPWDLKSGPPKSDRGPNPYQIGDRGGKSVAPCGPERAPGVPPQVPPSATFRDSPSAPHQNPPRAPHQNPPRAPHQAPPSVPHQTPASVPHRAPPSTPYQAPPSTPYQAPPSTPYQAPPSVPHRAPPSSPHQAPPSAPHQTPPSAPNQAPPSVPHRHVAAFPPQIPAPRHAQNHCQPGERPSSGAEPVFPAHQGQRSTLFNNAVGAPSHSLKRKTMFEEVEYSGDGQLPFRASVPERVGPDWSRYAEGQEARPGEEYKPRPAPSAFKTANEQLVIQNQKKFGQRGAGSGGAEGVGPVPSVPGKRSLGTTRRGLNSKFISPVMSREDAEQDMWHPGSAQREGSGSSKVNGDGGEEVTDVRLKGIDPKMIELVTNEIMDHGPPIHWDDIAGLDFAKTTIKEIVVWPMLRPDIFTGLRGPPKGLLLFGPPGTGKTLIGKCIASQSGATFFSISASSLTSKWVGEGEKMVRALFAVARCHQPAVIFIDEIDSLLSQRSNDEHESSRRIKTEFLVQLDGATTGAEDRLLVVGATNRPQEIDEAARRRLVKRLYIPLPEAPARRQIVQNLLAEQSYSLTADELDRVCRETDGYSGADMANLCREAALGPIRCIQGMDIQHISADQVRPILYEDFQGALLHMRPSVSKSDLDIYLEWNKTFGTGASK